MTQLSPREKIMAMIVGGVLAILVNLIAFSYVMKTYRRLTSDLEVKRGELATLQKLSADKEVWAQRDTWLTQKQPKLGNPTNAGVKFLDEIKEIAQRTGVTLETPTMSNPSQSTQYTSVSVSLETKSDWPQLIKFMTTIQAPDRFIALDSVKLEVDNADKTKMHGTFRIARWHARQ